jgi:hypothetical protein
MMVSQPQQGKKLFSRTLWAYLMATVFGGVVAGPPGALLSPLALAIANRKGEFITEKGQKITPITMWVAVGLVFTPLCWYLNTVTANKAPPAPVTATPPQAKPTATEAAKTQPKPVATKLETPPIVASPPAPSPVPIPARVDAPQSSQPVPFRFGQGDDAAALLERCSRPDRDYDSGKEVPRPVIVTRNMEYRSQGVRVWFAPRDWGWELMFFQDLVTGKGITPEEGMRRMGNTCR